MCIFRVEAVLIILFSFITSDESELNSYLLWLLIGNSIIFIISEKLLTSRLRATNNLSPSHDITNHGIIYISSAVMSYYFYKKYISLCDQTTFNVTMYALLQNISVCGKICLDRTIFKKYGYLKVKVI